MAAELALTSAARDDLDEGYAWYEKHREGLGEDFLQGVDDCMNRIVQNPQLYERVRESYRRALVKRFPYAVFYEFDATIVTVYGVLHTSRDPRKWRRRLP